MDIREVGQDEHTLHRRMWEVGKAAEDAHRVYDFYWPWPTAQLALSEGRADFDETSLGAFVDGELVAFARLSHPTLDNTHLAFASFLVHPDHQRRGIGRALVERSVEVVRAHGRRLIVADAYARPGEDSPAVLFATALGFTEGIEDGMKVLDLVESAPGWDALEEEALRRSAGYTILSWHDDVPPEYLVGYCYLNEAYFEEAPLGELDMGPEVWDEKRVRNREAQNRDSGRHVVATVAVSPDGAVVGLTEVMVNAHAPHRSLQAGTLVLPDHRGRQLGTAMKIENQREVVKRFPECRILMTGNAGVNIAMNTVNDRIGFREVERCIEMQREV